MTRVPYDGTIKGINNDIRDLKAEMADLYELREKALAKQSAASKRQSAGLLPVVQDRPLKTIPPLKTNPPASASRTPKPGRSRVNTPRGNHARSIVADLMAYGSQDRLKLAKRLGISPGTITYWCAQPWLKCSTGDIVSICGDVPEEYLPPTKKPR